MSVRLRPQVKRLSLALQSPVAPSINRAPISSSMSSSDLYPASHGAEVPVGARVQVFPIDGEWLSPLEVDDQLGGVRLEVFLLEL